MGDFTSLPLEGKAAIREYHPLKRRQSRQPLETIHSPSTVIPSAAEGSLLHCRHIHTCTLTQTTPWCFLFRLSLTHVLPLSLHFGPHDTQERRIVSYRFSYRCVELCLFEALYPAPLARSFYILMHRHRPTHCPHKTHRMRNLCHSRSEVTLSTHAPRTSPFSSSIFHTASDLSAPSGHLPLEGKALYRVQRLSHKWCT